MLGPRQPREQLVGSAHNVPMTLLGTALLWLGWFGFNAGSALAADAVAAHALLTTHMAAASALFAWVVLDRIFKKKTTLSGLCIGVVAGLVTITPAAGFVLITDACLMGIAGAGCSYMALQYFHRRSLDDTLDVFACHGVAGIVGSVLTGVFATASVNPGGSNGLLYGNAGLLWTQIEATVVAIVFSGAATAVILKVLDLAIGLKVEDAQEPNVDQNLHGERAYAGEGQLPLGELLVQAGLVSEQQIQQCLQVQKQEATHRPIGVIARQRNLITAQQLQQVLGGI